MSEHYTVVGIALGASLSPLLTFAYLWQIKEWRLDRIKEHLRSEGCCSQFFGKTRPTLLGLFFLLGMVGMQAWQINFLLALCLLNAGQILLRKQRTPVWTMKAIAIVGSSLLFNALLTLFASPVLLQFLFALPFIQPLIVLLAWCIFYPVDTYLKRKILQKARVKREMHAQTTVIGITGSVGKTTTKELLRHILKNKNMVTTPAYVNSEIGVARWLIANLHQNIDVAVVEMGAYRPGEIAVLCSVAQPNMGIITSIGKQHLALFKTQEALCNAKAELLEALPADGIGYVNADNALCASVASRAICPVRTVGTGGTATLEAYNIEETADGIQFTVSDQIFSIRLHGTHNVTNVLLALAVAQDLGISLAECAKNVQSFTVPETTFSVKKIGTITVLNDTHNASPSSFQAALRWAKNQPHEKCTLVTSGLLELGKDQDAIHTELGGLAKDVCNRVVFLHKRNAKHFEKGFQKPVEMFSATSAPVPEHSLLLCIGRLSEHTLQQLLPSAS